MSVIRGAGGQAALCCYERQGIHDCSSDCAGRPYAPQRPQSGDVSLGITGHQPRRPPSHQSFDETLGHPGRDRHGAIVIDLDAETYHDPPRRYSGTAAATSDPLASEDEWVASLSHRD